MLPRAILLAGGKSSRFGSNKAVADIGGQTLSAYCVSRLLDIFAKVIVVAKGPTELGLGQNERVRLVCDSSPECAAIIGLCEGLRRADRILNYVTGCDMPGVVPELVNALHALAKGNDCALRCDRAGKLQPLGGFYSKAALPTIENFVMAGDYRLSSLLESLRVTSLPFPAVARLDPQLRSFVNVNTRSDLDTLNWV